MREGNSKEETIRGEGRSPPTNSSHPFDFTLKEAYWGSKWSGHEERKGDKTSTRGSLFKIPNSVKRERKEKGAKEGQEI